MTETLTPAQARKKHQKTFDRFWSAYPRRTHINEAADAWARLMESGADPVRIVKAAKGFAASVGSDLQYCPGPHRWLEGGRYEDASLFEDEVASAKSWLKQMWREANVKAVENKYHISKPKRYPPDDVTSTDGIRAWYRQDARDWITEVYRSRVECQSSTPTMTEQSSPYSEEFSTTQESLQTLLT